MIRKTLFVVSQIWLPVTGLPTIYFTGKKSKLALFFGLLGQPAWIYSTVYSEPPVRLVRSVAIEMS